jgi:hypothetical protein
MCAREKASCDGSSAPKGRGAAQEEKRSQSGEDSDESTKKTKKKKDLTKDPRLQTLHEKIWCLI